MENLKILRMTRGLTQAEQASEVGVTQSLVAQWERGASMPGAAKLPLLAEILHCTIDDLFRQPEQGQEGG